MIYEMVRRVPTAHCPPSTYDQMVQISLQLPRMAGTTRSARIGYSIPDAYLLHWSSLNGFPIMPSSLYHQSGGRGVVVLGLERIDVMV